jgi:hypothetical protein
MLRRLLPLTLLALLLAVPASAHAAVSAKKGIWGPAEIDAESQFPLYRQLGAGIYMTKLEWDKVAQFQPDRATDPLDTGYDWPDELDTVLDEAKRNKIKVALTVTGTPEWANGGKQPHVPPRRTKDFADFLTAAARRYPTARLWIIWDSPAEGNTFKPVSASRYARLLDAAYGALKKRSKLNLVVGGNSSRYGKVSTQRWINGLKLPNGKRPRLDIYGHDGVSNRKLTKQDITTLSRQVDAAFGPKRLFLTNYSLPTSTNWRYPFKVSTANQASWLTAALRLAKRESKIFALAYNGLLDEGARPDGKPVKAGLIDGDGERRKAFNAFKRG